MGYAGCIEGLVSRFSRILHPVLSGGQPMVQVNASFGGIALKLCSICFIFKACLAPASHNYFIQFLLVNAMPLNPRLSVVIT